MNSSSVDVQPEKQKHTWHCTHCRTEMPVQNYTRVQTDEDVVFCCGGCEMVFNILSANKLGQYYKIKKKSEFFSIANPVEAKPGRFEYLDDESFREKYAYGKNGTQMSFYIEGIHCVACLWLMERVRDLVKDVKSSEMDLGTMVLRIEIEEGGSFSAVADMLDQLGYKPHAIENADEAEALQFAEDKKQLLELGIAGFCMSNIMLLFISIYAGVSGALLDIFRYLSAGLFLPIAFYSARPFYKSAWGAFKTRQMSIDVPVTLAIAFGAGAGFYHLLIGAEHIYFDSLSVFVFLLLGTRFFLKKLHQKVSGKTDFSEFLIPQYVFMDCQKSGVLKRVPVNQVNSGDVIQIGEGDVIAVDGEVLSGESYVDCHMLNGESMPVSVKPGAEVFAGTVNQGHPLKVKVRNTGSETRLSKMLENINTAEKPVLVQDADRIAKWYLVFILATSLGVLAFFAGSHFSEGFNRALALIIVACPCALALATPLAYSMGLRETMKQGVLLKGPIILEKLARVRNLFIDKTGTLTHGQFDVLDWTVEKGESAFYDEAYALEKNSKHPIALAIRRYVEKKGLVDSCEVSDFKEVLGVGVSGQIRGRHYEMKSWNPETSEGCEDLDRIESYAGIFIDGECCVKIRLGDRLRKSSRETLDVLRSRLDRIVLVSGDREAAAETVSRQLNLKEFYAQVSPEKKQEFVQGVPDALMVGDGANDALALSSAFVSAAVHGSLDVSFKTADIYFLKPGIDALPGLLKSAQNTRRVIHRNLAISLIYNVAGVLLALGGWVTPLVAAVVMPLSSISVLLSSFLGIRSRNVPWKS